MISVRQHRRFEIQCLLAASGQLTDIELSELQSHANECKDCSARIQQMCYVSSQLMGVQKVERPQYQIPAGSAERFAHKARTEGIPIKSTTPYSQMGSGLRLSVVCVLILLSIGIFSLALSHFSLNQAMANGELPHQGLRPRTDVLSIPDSSSSVSSMQAPSLEHRASSHTNPRRTLRTTERRIRRPLRDFRFSVGQTAETKELNDIFGFDSSRVSRLSLAFPKPVIPFPQWFRNPAAVSSVRPLNFRVSVDRNSVCSPEIHDDTEDQQAFCFNPTIAFLAKYDSPHLPSITWSGATP